MAIPWTIFLSFVACLIFSDLCDAGRIVDRSPNLGDTVRVRAAENFRDDVSLTSLERRIRKRKQTRYTIFAVESPTGYANINFESTIKFVKTSLDLISEFDHYPEIKFFVDRKHKVAETSEELPYRYSLFSMDLARNRSQHNFERITEFIRSSSDFIHAERMEIFVKSASGKVVALDVDAAETVENIKAKIHEKEGIPPNMQRLQFEGQALKNERRLYDYNIRQDSTLDLSYGIDISIRISQNLMLNLRASPADTIASVKQKLLDIGGATLDKIKLNYGGQELANERRLNDYDVRNGSILEATVIQTTSAGTSS